MTRVTLALKVCLGLVVVIYLLGSYLFVIPMTKPILHSFIQAQISDALSKDVTIEDVEGTFFSSIVLSNVVIQNSDEYSPSVFAVVKHVSFDVSFFHFLANAQLLKKVTFEDVSLNVIRNRDKKVNVFDFFDLSNIGHGFNNVSIVFDNVSGEYHDYRGWGRVPEHFEHSFTQGKGRIDVDRDGNLDLSVSISLEEPSGQLFIQGGIQDGTYMFEFDVNQLNVDQWSSYLVPTPLVDVSDDIVTIRGTLTNRDLLKQPNGGFYYDIDVLFDYLTLTLPNQKIKGTNLNGRVKLINIDRPELKIDSVIGEYHDLLMQANGSIYFDTKTYDLRLRSLATVNHDYMVNFLGIQTIPGVDYDASLTGQLTGSFRHPKFNVHIGSDSVFVGDYGIGRVYLDVSKTRDGFEIKSLGPSKVFVSGEIVKNLVDLQVDFKEIDVPIFDHPVEISFEAYGPMDALKTSITLPKLHQNVFGYTINKIQSNVVLGADRLAISDMSIDLENTQKLFFEGGYDFQHRMLYLNQSGLQKLSKLMNSQRIDSMESQINMQYLNGHWDVQVTSNIIGAGAKVLGIPISEYGFSLSRNADEYLLDVDYFYSEGQRFDGQIIFDGENLKFIDAKFSQLQLKYMSQFIPSLKGLDISGTSTGRVSYRYDPRVPNLDMVIDIENLSFIQGQLGNVFIEMVNHGKGYDIINFRSRGLHHLNLTGHLESMNAFELSPMAGSMIRLDAFDYFSKQKLFGHVKLAGTFKGSSSGFEYDGSIESDDFEFDGHRFDYLFSDLSASSSTVDFRRLLVEHNGGKMDIYGNIQRLSMPRDEFDYALNLDLHFSNFDIKLFSNIYQSYLHLNELSLDSLLDFNLTNRFAYHKYQLDNLSLFNDYNAPISTQKNPWNFEGKMNGNIIVNTNQIDDNAIDLTVDQFRLFDIFSAKHLRIASTKPDTQRQDFKLSMEGFIYNDAQIDYFDTLIHFFPKQGVIKSSDQNIRFDGLTIDNIMAWSYRLDDRFFDLNMDLKKNDLSILSFVFVPIKTIRNDGRVKFSLSGPLDQMSLVFSELSLNKFKLSFDSERSNFNSSIMVDRSDLRLNNNVIYFDSIDVDWQGVDTYRRVTRNEKKNNFVLNGSLTINKLDFMDRMELMAQYDLNILPSFFSVNFPLIYSGDILSSKLTFSGQQTYPFSYSGRQVVFNTLGTKNESGPTLNGQIIFRDGVFNVPKLGAKKRKMRMGLDLSVIIGPGNYVQGSIVGDGVYNLANNVSLEIHEKMQDLPFNVSGMLNSPNMSTAIHFYEGSVTIFDGVYELIRTDQQSHYFKEMPELISEQFVFIRPSQVDGKPHLGFDIHLRGLRKKDSVATTENIRNFNLPFSAIGLVMDGDLQKISQGFTVLDFGLDSYQSTYPNYEFYGAYQVNLLDQQSLSQQSQYGLTLVMPEIITNTEASNFNQYGRQQVNSFVKSSIRPYERRLARRFGLYDFRLDYDFGRSFFYSDSDVFQSQDLLGLSVVSNLYKEKMFLTVRSDVNLSSDESVSYERGIKITQLELKYFFEPNFSVGMKNINEYAEITSFDPRFSINYGYAF
tara:strand:- start:5232 stop:9908 length:4677 start_codon:yes stop_codon:yes gene_type:complete